MEASLPIHCANLNDLRLDGEVISTTLSVRIVCPKPPMEVQGRGPLLNMEESTATFGTQVRLERGFAKDKMMIAERDGPAVFQVDKCACALRHHKDDFLKLSNALHSRARADHSCPKFSISHPVDFFLSL